MTSAPASLPIVSRTHAIEDPGPLLSLLPETPSQMAWVRRGSGLVAWGVAAVIETGGPTRFSDAAKSWTELVGRAIVRDDVDLPGTGPIAFGSFAFSEHSPAGGVLVVPEVVVGCREGTWFATTIGLGTAPSLAPDLAPGAVPGTQPGTEPGTEPGTRTGTELTAGVPPVPAPTGAVRFEPGARRPDDWAATVGRAIERILAGDVEKVVLARDVVATTEFPVDPRGLLERLAEVYPGCWTFSVDGLVGATPELLVRLERGMITSRVLAGTIRRRAAGADADPADDAHDLWLAASLARSSKDLEEHEYAVRSVAEALAPFCATTNVPESPFVLHLANVMHLATDVTGVLREPAGAGALDVAAALHPSAAVCGTPTRAASELIDELEGMDRDRYAGPVGWIDARGDGEWGIALRCARIDVDDPHRLRLFAGCGIVAGSDPAAELAESEAKLLPMRNALLP